MPIEIAEALKELESSTAALLEAEASDTNALYQALERRANAITQIARAIGSLDEPDSGIVHVLNSALARGEEAARKVLHMKQDATAEWSRLSRVLQGLSASKDVSKPGLDYSA